MFNKFLPIFYIIDLKAACTSQPNLRRYVSVLKLVYERVAISIWWQGKFIRKQRGNLDGDAGMRVRGGLMVQLVEFQLLVITCLLKHMNTLLSSCARILQG